LATRSNPLQAPKMHKPLSTPVLGILRFLGVYVPVLCLLFAFSSLQIVFTIAALTFGILWFVSNRRMYVRTKKLLQTCLIVTLAFIIVFSGIQFYVFETSGYPPTSAPQFSHTDLLNASLTQYLQNVEQSENFRLLQVNHFGTVTFERIELHSYGSSWIQWTFHARDTNSRITMGNKAGQPYYTNIDSLLSSIFPRPEPPTKDFPLQIIKESFRQIDSLGLNWFQNYAATIYENQTGTKPNIAALNVNIGFDNPNGYEGLTVVLSARSLDHDSRGTQIYPGIFEAEFQPNGTLLTFNNLTIGNSN
jgi:hypothetical protein